MSREQWVKRWRGLLAGVISLGTTDFRRKISAAMKDMGSIESYGEALVNVGETADDLLRRLYDDLARRLAPQTETPDTVPLRAKQQ